MSLNRDIASFVSILVLNATAPPILPSIVLIMDSTENFRCMGHQVEDPVVLPHYDDAMILGPIGYNVMTYCNSTNK